MSQSAAIAEPAATRANAPGSSQYVTFVCAGVEYGVEILRVQEIKGWDGVTRVPYTPPYILGVMNLRGVIVPVIDLRARFGLESKPHDSSTVVIVVRVDAPVGEKTVSGLTSVDDKMVMLLDMNRLVASSIDLSAQPQSAD